jgi:two-component system cell cycle response regulator DivK
MSAPLILVVEDDAKSRRLARDVLEAHGYRVAEATTGDEALRLACSLRPALILMDVHLPVRDGISALAAIRREPATRAIPVIAVTASAMAQERATILAAGFDGYHPKPIEIDRLVGLVRSLIDAAGGGG